jgi:uncharacterized membrane protein YhaH (DUF805 family)
MNLGNMLFSFRGRINRAKWWLAVALSILISIVVGLLAAVIQNDSLNTVLTIVGYLITLWIGLAAAAKRLHDLNRSAAWLVLFYGAPILLMLIMIGVAAVSVGGAIVSGQGQDLSPDVLAQLITQLGGIGLIIVVLLIALGLWALIWLGFLRGTVGPNQYGPDPLEGRV